MVRKATDPASTPSLVRFYRVEPLRTCFDAETPPTRNSTLRRPFGRFTRTDHLNHNPHILGTKYFYFVPNQDPHFRTFLDAVLNLGNSRTAPSQGPGLMTEVLIDETWLHRGRRNGDCSPTEPPITEIRPDPPRCGPFWSQKGPERVLSESCPWSQGT